MGEHENLRISAERTRAQQAPSAKHTEELPDISFKVSFKVDHDGAIVSARIGHEQFSAIQQALDRLRELILANTEEDDPAKLAALTEKLKLSETRLGKVIAQNQP